MKRGASLELKRSAIYKLLSSAFLYPDEDLYVTTREVAGGAPFSLAGDGLERVEERLRVLRETLEGKTLGEMQLEHQRVFGHTMPKEYPPYETQYGSSHLFQQVQELADAAGFYRAFGLEISDEAKETPDHIGIQLEFMHFLSFKEAYAAEHHGQEEIDICRDAQKKFVGEHLGRWAPLFCKLLMDKIGDGFYGRLASVTSDFMDFEKGYLCVKPDEVKSHIPLGAEDGTEDFSCAGDESMNSES